MRTLSTRYQDFYGAAVGPDERVAYTRFLDLLGLAADGPVPPSVAPEPSDRRVAMMVYRIPRPIDLAALEMGVRAVAKFEDLPQREAAALTMRLRQRGFRVVHTPPYRRRFDLAWSGGGQDEWLYSVIASRGGEADAVAAAERTRDAGGTRLVGTLLGYPPCCVERFVEVERSEKSERDGVNETWMRVFAGRERVPWVLNPLSLMSPVGFAPCTATCTRAVAFAHTILDAIRARDATQYRVVEATLRRPVLFFRFPLFYVFDGVVAPDGSVPYAQALANNDGSAVPASLRTWQLRVLGAALTRGDHVALKEGVLEVRRGDTLVSSWRITEPDVPLLLRWS